MSLTPILKSVWQAIVAWFVAQVWPEIQKFLVTVVKDVFEWLYKKIRDWFQRSEQQERAFNEKAQESERKAKEATSEAEAEKCRAIAKVWREAFELYRRENEKLKAELGEVLANGAAKAAETANSLKVDDIFEFSSDEEVRLKADLLPILPSVEEKSKNE